MIDIKKIEALKKAIVNGNTRYALEYIRYEVGCGHNLAKLDEVLVLLNWWLNEYEPSK